MNQKKIYFILAILFTVNVLLGCSVFISTPRVARYHVQGLDNQLMEYRVPIDSPSEGNLDIQLSDHYAIQFDFDWLWNTDADISDFAVSDDTSAAPSLAPWMLCKYRF